MVCCLGKVSFKKIMYISPLTMYYLTKKTLPGHIKCKKFEKIITTVLQYHTVLSCFLRCLYELPAFVNRDGGRHFYSHMLTLLHRINSHGSMQMPRSCY